MAQTSPFVASSWVCAQMLPVDHYDLSWSWRMLDVHPRQKRGRLKMRVKWMVSVNGKIPSFEMDDDCG